MYKILVVDDSSMIRAIYKQYLKKLKRIEPHFVTNGVEAISTIQKDGPFALTFLDINMPEMDGLECLAALSKLEILPTMRVVIVSTEGSAEDVERGMQAGAAHYLKKPFQALEFYEVVSGFLGQSIPELERDPSDALDGIL